LFSWRIFVRLLARTSASRASVRMSGFGSTSLKALSLQGTAPLLPSLESLSKRLFRAAPAPAASSSLVTRRVLENGRWSVNGKKKELKDSGAYTRAFGEAVATRQAI
jgi:hypothetical protein